MTNFEKSLIENYNRYQTLMKVANACDPKTFGQDKVSKNKKMRGGSKRK